jgi:serine protease Do
MNISQIHLGPRTIRGGLGVIAVALLVAGGTWRGVVASDTQSHSAAPVAVTPPTTAVTPRTSYADVVKAVAPAVVTIRVEGRAQASPTSFSDDDLLRRFFGDQFEGPRQPRSFRQRGLGSGVIVSSDGYILTNHHVVGGADDIRVDLIDGRSLKARLIGSDTPSDLAVVKVDASNLHALQLGNSDAVQVGDVVLAVGDPLGIGQTVTMGIISAKGRSTGVGDGSYEDFLQTDASINQGNSGGALVNVAGELIGINSQIVSPSGGNIGIGFAIPANMAGHVMTLLRTEGRVRRGQLGVTVQPVTSELAASLSLKDVGGAIVSSVTPGGPADHAGVKRGDVILSLNGQPLKDSNALRNRVAEAGPGSRAMLLITRNGTQREIAVTLGEGASTAARVDENGGEADRQTSLGISVAPLTRDLAQELGVTRVTHGLLVQEVEPSGRAAGAGIQPGDVIEEVNQQPVQTVGELRNAIRMGSARPLLLLVNRNGREVFLTASTS